MGTIKNAVSKANSVKGTINPRYDMTIYNMSEIYDTYGGTFESISCSFKFGYMQGMKAAKAETKRGGAVNG